MKAARLREGLFAAEGSSTQISIDFNAKQVFLVFLQIIISDLTQQTQHHSDNMDQFLNSSVSD